MAKVGTVELSVPEDIVERWRRLPENERARIEAKFVSLVAKDKTPVEEFRELCARLDPKLKASGLTDEIVDAELAAWKAERRRRR
jgi:hypothetical protein